MEQRFKLGLQLSLRSFPDPFPILIRRPSQGSASAFNNLGICYEDGLGVTADVALAAQFYRQAALRGHSMAVVNLAHVSSRVVSGP